MAPHRYHAFQNKKAFQSNANLPFSNCPYFIVNKLKHMWGGGDGQPVPGPVQGELWQVPYRKGIGAEARAGSLFVEGAGTLYRDPP